MADVAVFGDGNNGCCDVCNTVHSTLVGGLGFPVQGAGQYEAASDRP